jgi:hypothetical protein
MTSENKAVAAFFTEFPNAPCVHEVAGQLFHDNAEEAAKARADFYGCEMETTENPNSIRKLLAVKKAEILKGETDKTDVETEIDGNVTDVETEIDGNANEVETEIYGNVNEVETEINDNVTAFETEINGNAMIEKLTKAKGKKGKK